MQEDTSNKNSAVKSLKALHKHQHLHQRFNNHPKFRETARRILQRIEAGEPALTSTLILCEVAWVLEAIGKQSEIKPTLEKILSYPTLKTISFNKEDLLAGANNALTYQIDFNDGVNIAIIEREGIYEVYSNDKRHLGKIDHIKLIFE